MKIYNISDEEKVKAAFDEHYAGSLKRALRRKSKVQEKKYPMYNEYQRLSDEYDYPYSFEDITFEHFPRHFKDLQELEELLSIVLEKQYKDIKPVNPKLILDYYKELCGIVEWPICMYSRYIEEILYPDEEYSPFRIYLSNNWVDYYELEDLDNVMDALGYFRQKPSLWAHSTWRSYRIIRYWPYSQIDNLETNN